MQNNPYASPVPDSDSDTPGKSPDRNVSGWGNIVFLGLGAYLCSLGVVAMALGPSQIALRASLPVLTMGVLLFRHGLIRHRIKAGPVGFALLWLAIFLIAFFFFLLVIQIG